MRTLVITGLVALTLTLALTVGSARFVSFTAHITGPAHPVLADNCSSAQTGC
jgi:hypothetical protein